MITTPQHTFTYTPAHYCFSGYALLQRQSGVFKKKPISYLLLLIRKRVLPLALFVCRDLVLKGLGLYKALSLSKDGEKDFFIGYA